jgi:glycosyltransferase involved in cell wall biosynthesis
MRVVTNFHELYIPFDMSLQSNLGALWQRAATALLAWGSNTLSVTAGEWKRRFERMGIEKGVEMIPVGSNIPVTTISEEERARLRKSLLGTSDGLLVGGFGGQQHRDMPALLYGLRELKRQGPVKLVWIGGGRPDDRYRVSLERAMHASDLDENDVEWTGVLPHPQVSRTLSACDVMTLPFVDGCSTRRTSAVTALQHGLPLLTTSSTRPEPWFVHGQNVHLVPIGDGQALADGLVELARKPELRARLAKGARALYEAHFAWDVIARQVSSLVQGGSSL